MKNNSNQSKNDSMNKTVVEYKKWSMWEGILLVVFLSCTTRATIAGYELFLGFSNSLIGLISGSILIISFISPFAPNLIGRIGNIKSLAISSRILAMLFMNVLLLLPLPSILPAAFILFWSSTSIQALFSSINAGLWSIWWYAALPINEQISFSIKRQTITTIVGIAILWLSGRFLDTIAIPLGFLVIIGIGNLAGLLSVIPMTKQPEFKTRPKSLMDAVIALQRIFFSPRLRSVAIIAIVFCFGFYMIACFLPVYLLKNLHLSFTNCAIWMIIGQQATLYTLKRWNHLANKFGFTNVLIICVVTFGIILPLSLILSSQSFSLPIYIAALIEGGCGTVIASFYISLANKKATSEEKEYIIPAFSVIRGFSAGLSTIATGFLYDFLDKTSLPSILTHQLQSFDIIAIVGAAIVLSTIIPLLKSSPPQTKFRAMLPYLIPTLLFFWKKPEFVEAIEKKKDDSIDNSKEDK